MPERLVKVKNESGAEFIVPESHFYSYKEQHKLTLMGVFLSEATPDLIVIKKTLSYIDAMFPAGILHVQINNDVPEINKKWAEDVLQKLKELRRKRIGEISDPFYEIHDDSFDEKVHLFITPTSNNFKPSILRGGILLIIKNKVSKDMDSDIKKEFPSNLWESIHLTEQEKTSGMVLFRKIA